MALEGVAKKLLNREKRLFLNISNKKRLAIRNSMPMQFLARPEWAGWSIILWNESEKCHLLWELFAITGGRNHGFTRPINLKRT